MPSVINPIPLNVTHSAIWAKFHSQTWSQTRFPTTSYGSATSSRLFGSKAGRRLIRAISTCPDSPNQSATCFRSKKSRKLVTERHQLVDSQVGNQVCDLDIVMEFGVIHDVQCMLVRHIVFHAVTLSCNSQTNSTTVFCLLIH